MPSMVLMSAPSTNEARYRQPETGRSSTITVQQPYWPDGEQPSFGDVMSSWRHHMPVGMKLKSPPHGSIRASIVNRPSVYTKTCEQTECGSYMCRPNG